MTPADPTPFPPLTCPEGRNRVLLHVCCAPCSGAIIEAMLDSGIDLCVFFYNPNIHPHAEYERRKDEAVRFTEKLGLSFVDADADRDAWIARTRGQEQEPERGRRCTLCFDMRLERTARHAKEHDFPVIATSLGISRWKDQRQVNDCGRRAAAQYPGLIYWDYNWRKKGGTERTQAISQRERFYRQEYCGCVYSLRQANDRRAAMGREPIRLGVTKDVR